MQRRRRYYEAIFYGFVRKANHSLAPSQRKNPEILRVQFGDIIVDFGGYAAWNQAGRIDLTPKEIELLKLLLEHKGLVLTRSQILDELWGYDAPIIDRTVDTYIKNLRKKLNLDRIITVKGVGYKYEESL